uniref:Transposase Tc1-like domain-containing protein n=1 Tax=Oncorhynchus tshawytscha TaxID=74940 RepID=A0AAZ3S2Q7_ONCTS
MMKLALMRTDTGKEDPELPLLQRTSSLEIPDSEIAAQIKATQSSSNRHISTSTVQRRLRESGLYSQIAAKITLLKEPTNKKKRLACAKKHEQWTLARWKSDLWSDESKFEIFGSNRHVFVGRRVGEQIISACVVPTVKHGGGGVTLWRCYAGDTVCDLFRIQGTLNQHGYHRILQRYAIPSGLYLVGLSFVFQHNNDPTHLQAV